MYAISNWNKLPEEIKQTKDITGHPLNKHSKMGIQSLGMQASIVHDPARNTPEVRVWKYNWNFLYCFCNSDLVNTYGPWYQMMNWIIKISYDIHNALYIYHWIDN